jgi:hypothetical protein
LVFQKQCGIVSISPIPIHPKLLHLFPDQTHQHTLINTYLWSKNREYLWIWCGGFLIINYTHHGFSFFLPSAICDDIQLCNDYWHKPITFLLSSDTSIIYWNSYLWSHNENITEYGIFWIVSYTHHLVSFCLPTAIQNCIRLSHPFLAQSYYISFQLRHIPPLLIAICDPIMRIFVNMEVGIKLRWLKRDWFTRNLLQRRIPWPITTIWQLLPMINNLLPITKLGQHIVPITTKLGKLIPSYCWLLENNDNFGWWGTTVST